MGTDRVCVYIPVEEYRELVQAKRDAECLKRVLMDDSLSYIELGLLRKMFIPQEESGDPA